MKTIKKTTKSVKTKKPNLPHDENQKGIQNHKQAAMHHEEAAKYHHEAVSQ
jgi:hypothetical protein